jgi:hypothetical protein
LKEREIYCDTVSVIYIQKCEQPSAATCGDWLGNITIELAPEKYIEEFVSGGPKNYTHRIVNARILERKTVHKVRESLSVTPQPRQSTSTA